MTTFEEAATADAAHSPAPTTGGKKWRSIDFLLAGESVRTNRHLVRFAAAPYLQRLLDDPHFDGLMTRNSKQLRKELIEAYAVVSAVEALLTTLGRRPPIITTAAPRGGRDDGGDDDNVSRDDGGDDDDDNFRGGGGGGGGDGGREADDDERDGRPPRDDDGGVAVRTRRTVLCARGLLRPVLPRSLRDAEPVSVVVISARTPTPLDPAGRRAGRPDHALHTPSSRHARADVPQLVLGPAAAYISSTFTFHMHIYIAFHSIPFHSIPFHCII